MWLISGRKISGNDYYQQKWSFVEKRPACKDGHHLLIYALFYLYEQYFLEAVDETSGYSCASESFLVFSLNILPGSKYSG